LNLRIPCATAKELEFQSRAYSSIEHPATGGGNHLAAISVELVLSHSQIEDGWQNPKIVEIHSGLLAIH
jgi:hypothetical protein